MSDDKNQGGLSGAAKALCRLLRQQAAVLIIVALSVLVLVLSVQQRRLRAEAESLREKVEWPYRGMVVPTFKTRTLDGDTVTIGDPDPGSTEVLFIFDTRCGNCAITIPAWKEMASALEPHADSVRVYGISLDPPAESRAYVKEKEIGFPVVRFPDERFGELFHVTGVPITLVVGSGGRVDFVFPGSISRNVGVYRDSVVTAALGERTSAQE